MARSARRSCAFLWASTGSFSRPRTPTRFTRRRRQRVSRSCRFNPSRPVTLDGVARDARFRTTRLDPAQVAMGRVYFCEHQTPDLVWRPEWQTHPNGACAIARVVVATADPQRTARLFRGLFGDEIVADRNWAQI